MPKYQINVKLPRSLDEEEIKELRRGLWEYFGDVSKKDIVITKV